MGPLQYFDASRLNVGFGYQIPEDGPEAMCRASRWLAVCVREAVDRSGLDCASQRVVVIVGTGLRELRAVERGAAGLGTFETEWLHFRSAVRGALPDVSEVMTLSNACSAGGHALALAQDLLELGEADAVVAAAADGMTESMLAMIGRFADSPTPSVRPFDRSRRGALLGEGAAAMVVVPERDTVTGQARLLSTGMSCDAAHETVPGRDGILRAVSEAFSRAGRTPADVDLVIAHGTGTLLNDPTEASVLHEVFGDRASQPLITGIKGALGHTSGSAALMSVDVAMRCLTHGTIPPLIGLQDAIDEGRALRFVSPDAAHADVRLAQVNAFGFGGVNAITLLEKAA